MDTETSRRDFDFIPGLSNQNINLLHGNDMFMIEDTITDILHSVNEEHPVVQTIDKVFLAVLKSKLPRKRLESRKDLEEILKEQPNHLNALVELENIYRSLHRIADADKLKERYEEISKSSKNDDIKEKVTCLVEQSFVMRIERTLVNENSLFQQMNNTHNMIKNEYESSEEAKKEHLGKSLNYYTRFEIEVKRAFDVNSVDGHYKRLKRCLLKYEQAFDLCPLSDLHPAWRFQYAKTLNQFYNYLSDLDKEENTHKEEMIEVTVQAVKIFWDVIQQRIPNMRRYKAQSHAYLGHIFIRKKIIEHVLPQLKKKITLAKTHFDRYCKEPVLFHESSVQLFKNDVVVLNRYGRSLWLLSKQTNDDTIKTIYLKQALCYLTISVEKGYVGNRFALSCRMAVNKDLAMLEKDKYQSKRFLIDAKRDGIACSYCMPTRRDMNILAEISQMLAKFPNYHQYGIKAVVSPDNLHEALEFLQYGNNLGEPIDSYFTGRLASCLFDLDEIEEAVNWQQRTWLMSPQHSYSFVLMCYFIMNVLKKKENDIEHMNILLSLLNLGEKRYKNEEMHSIYLKLYRKGKDEYYQTAITIIRSITDKQGNITIDKNEKTVLDHYLKVLKDDAIEITNLEMMLSKATLVPERDYTMEEIFNLPSWNSLPKALEKSFFKKYKFDYFISYSSQDKGFVHSILVHQLEKKLNEEDFSLKGCVDSRDFLPGVLIHENIEKAIAESNKVVLILTPAYVSSSYCKKEISRAFKSHLDRQKENHIIPVMYEECKTPDIVSDITFLDLTEKNDFYENLLKLKRALILD